MDLLKKLEHLVIGHGKFWQQKCSFNVKSNYNTAIALG